MSRPPLARISVIQTAFAGDVVLTLPFLARLCESEPQASMTVLCAPAGEGILRLALQRGLAAQAERIRIVRVDKRGAHGGLRGLRRLLREWRSEAGGAPDAVFCLQRSLRSGLLAWLSGAPLRMGFSSGAAAYFYSHCVPRPWDSGRGEIEKNLDLLRALHPAVAPWDPRSAPSLLQALQPVPPQNFIALSLGSPWATKRWPLENAAQLLEALRARGIPVTLIGDAAAQPLAEELLSKVGPEGVQNLCGKTSIEAWVDSIAAAKAVVSGDSAAVHIASDLQVPVLALFGPTLPQFGFAPWRRNGRALGLADLPCRPCHIHGPRVCPLAHHRCMKDLGAASVIDALRPFL